MPNLIISLSDKTILSFNTLSLTFSINKTSSVGNEKVFLTTFSCKDTECLFLISNISSALANLSLQAS